MKVFCLSLAPLLPTVCIYFHFYFAESFSIYSIRASQRTLKPSLKPSILQYEHCSHHKYLKYASTPAYASVSATTGESIKLSEIQTELHGEPVNTEIDNVLTLANDYVINPNSNKKFFIETHGCQMNLADSEVIRSVLLTEKYVMCDVLEDADLILTNTCSIRSVQSLD